MSTLVLNTPLESPPSTSSSPQALTEVTSSLTHAQRNHQVQDGRSPHLLTSTSTAVTVLNLEQCCICSCFYEQTRRPIPQPDLNKMICKVLDVSPQGSFFLEYLSLCVNCSNLLKQFDKIRIELEFIKTRVVTNVIETLTQIRPDGGGQLDTIKNQILERWTNDKTNRNSTAENYGTKDLSWVAHNNLMGNSVAVASTNSGTATARVATFSGDASSSAEVGGSPSDCRSGYSNIIVPNSPPDCHIEEDEIEENFDDPHPQEVDEERKNLLQTGEKKTRKRKKASKAIPRMDEEITPLICTKCGRLFHRRPMYTAHTQACESDDLCMDKICTICTEEQLEPCIFESWEDFKSHVYVCHPLVKLEICTFCRIRFLPFGVKHHKCTMTYKKEIDSNPIFKCDRCDKQYNSRANLTDHVRRSHKDQKHSCETCGKTYGSPMLLKFHVERHRLVVSKFKCDICGVCLSNNYSLKTHLKRHNGEQPFKCKLCSYTCTSRATLSIHKMVHSNVKPHKCQECGQRFKLTGTLKRHIKRHSLNETNYTKRCPLCPKTRFRKIWVLKQHMETVHPGTKEAEEIQEKFKDINDAPKGVQFSRSRNNWLSKVESESYSDGVEEEEDKTFSEEEESPTVVDERSKDRKKSPGKQKTMQTDPTVSTMSPRQSTRLKNKIRTPKKR